MKRIFLVILAIISFLLGWSQSHTRINNYWDNLYYINPASINERYSLTFSAVARKQWLNFPGSPATLFLSGTKLFDRYHVQMGAKAYVDKIGLTQTTYGALSYAYNLKLDETWNLNLGLAASFMSLHYDMEKATMDNIYDPTFQSQMASENIFNTDVGLEISSRTSKIGFSSQNLFSLFSSNKRYAPNTNILYGTYRTRTGYFLNYGFGLSCIQYANVIQPEAKVATFIKDSREMELFQVGMFYRFRNELGAIVNFNISPEWQVGYSYDFNVGSISRSSVGTHELMLIYRIDLCPTCY